MFFNLRRGTVATGRVESGAPKTGDELEIVEEEKQKISLYWC